MPSPPLPPARRRRRLTQLQAELAELDARLARDQPGDIEGPEASRRSSDSPHQQTRHQARPPVRSEPPPESLAKHTERAKRWATYVTLVGGAVVSLLISYYQQRAAIQQTLPPAPKRPEPTVILGTPQINPSHEAAPNASAPQQIPDPAAPPADNNRPIGP